MLIVADWPAPARVRAFATTRVGGCSAPPWDSFNLALHVGDEPGSVLRNRRILQETLGLVRAPAWMQQVHGCAVVDAADGDAPLPGDASYTARAGLACAVLTADCLPVLITNRAGTEVAAVHCGWRGLAAGILGAALRRFRSPAAELMAWLGPAIGQSAFEVGSEVRDAFLRAPRGEAARHAIEAAFLPHGAGAPKYHADLYALARADLAAFGLHDVSGGGWCTCGAADRFFSYRRDGVTGRMASLIWIENDDDRA